ncbi:hypothetical protein EYF80_037202 [Liparis tanakae]|uniref:Uncharacterized protein n=1 Tax=Liparis tanakae TaxID=230148 RepID=A0A4Z2GIL8_9TELE|nr:hypothetical protein EYF80_037202 [Liparis tanakae]
MSPELLSLAGRWPGEPASEGAGQEGDVSAGRFSGIVIPQSPVEEEEEEEEGREAITHKGAGGKREEVSGMTVISKV